MKKTVFVILSTVAVFLCAIVLGFATVFRVDAVTLEATVVSEQAKTEAKALEEKLRERYEKKNLLFLDTGDVEDLQEEFPYLKISSVEKRYPDGVLIKATEAVEAYAVENSSGGYYILDKEGSVLSVRESVENRLDGADNLLLKGLTFTGVQNGVPVGDPYFASVISVLKEADEILGGARGNLLSLEVVNKEPETIFRLTTREGVKLYLGNPSSMTEEKVKKAIDEYLGLSDEERLTGRVLVSETDGTVVYSYSKTDEFQK